MATIQAKISRGHKYWYIVESRRVNGKPRPVVLAYLGKADDLLHRLHHRLEVGRLKSYSHGAVALLLNLAAKLNVVRLINQQVQSPRAYLPAKPLRNHLTVGVTLLLGAIGRACLPTSKRGWWEWAKTTSGEYLLRCSLSKVDSQHFWDLMDALPPPAIPAIEAALLEKVRATFPLAGDTLALDTTNFFTFIATTNTRCTIAQRGKNKQKRHDLRQVGLALVVDRASGIPLFHLTYQGNRNDTKIFAGVVGAITDRLACLRFDLDQHTLVFDRGNNSKANLALVAAAKLHYVGALTPYQHRKLLAEAENHYQPVAAGGQPLEVYRARKVIWGEERTVLVFVSRRLKAGQIRGLYQNLSKKEAALRKLQQTLLTPKGATADRPALENRIAGLCQGQYLDGLIQWSLTDGPGGFLRLDFALDPVKLQEVEAGLGLRILMTDRHDWDTPSIIEAFYGQAAVEDAFRNIKNPYHLAVRPQYHWTDQKIAVHFFLCMLGYLLSMLLLREARVKADFKGSLESLLDRLNDIRLVAVMEKSAGQGKPKVSYKLEEMSAEDRHLFQALGGDSLHLDRPRLEGVGVYE